jgi:hypothetical protein
VILYCTEQHGTARLASNHIYCTLKLDLSPQIFKVLLNLSLSAIVVSTV